MVVLQRSLPEAGLGILLYSTILPLVPVVLVLGMRLERIHS